MDLHTLESMTHFEHSEKVAKISGLLASKAGFSPAEARMIGQAALYHDIGKSYIPADILQKPAKLTPEEYALVKTHTALGHRQIIDALCMLSAAAIIISQHHERPDGSGYLGLIGDDIHPYAKLVAVADVFDALLSRRAYKDAWGVDEVCVYMREQAGAQFDEGYVALLLENMDDIMELYENKERNEPK